MIKILVVRILAGKIIVFIADVSKRKMSTNVTKNIALLYDMGQDASKTPIENAKKYLDDKGIGYKEYTVFVERKPVQVPIE